MYYSRMIGYVQKQGDKYDEEEHVQACISKYAVLGYNRFLGGHYGRK